MTDLEWHNFLEIGVDFIDDDHKKLLQIMIETKRAIEEGDNSKCVQLLTSLIKEAKDHFHREEEYLLKVNYPDLKNHIIYHNELLIKADSTKRICEGIKSEHDLNECFNNMADFLIDDILRGDMRFKSFLQYEGHAES